MTEGSRARHVVAAAYLGWTLDAFDFFILVFVLNDVAKEFGVGLPAVANAIFWTLAMRAVGAFVFGRLADRYGRRPILMVNILCFSVLEFASGLAPNLLAFLFLRGAFGIAMGGEWGVGSSLTMESVPARWRGWVSGLLQSGYPSGYFLATVVFGIFYPLVGWRGMFMIGAIPALLVLYVRSNVPESPDWVMHERKHDNKGIWQVLGEHWKLAIYAIILMGAFNFFSHGTQDIYPAAFLQKQHGFDHATITRIALIYNAGAIIGGIGFAALSQKLGRRVCIVIASLLSLLVIPLWAFGQTVAVITIGAFLMQVCVQGAWGIIPAHLNELSPPSIRATFPGFVYQLGNFIASYNATIQTQIGAAQGGNYSWALTYVAAAAAIAIAVLVGFGIEARDVRMGQDVAPAE